MNENPAQALVNHVESALMKNGTLFLHSQRSDAQPSWAAIGQWECRKESGCVMVFVQSDFLSCWASHLACVQRQSRERMSISNWQRFAQSCKIWGGWHDVKKSQRCVMLYFILYLYYTTFSSFCIIIIHAGCKVCILYKIKIWRMQSTVYMHFIFSKQVNSLTFLEFWTFMTIKKKKIVYF